MSFSESLKLTRNEVRQILLDAWTELIPAAEDDARMDYWVWEWIQRYWPAEEIEDEQTSA